jgi:hypothetical protein
MTGPVIVHRCDVCGKWSHAQKRPKWHQRFLADDGTTDVPAGDLVIRWEDGYTDTVSGEGGDGGWWIKCGPFTSYQVVPLDPAAAHPGLVEWLARGDRGLSSEAIVEQLVLGGGNSDHPYDPGVFRRCEMLLRSVPTLRPLMPRMAAVSPEWAQLVKRWPDIVYALDSECPGWADVRRHGLAHKAWSIITDCIRAEVPS